MNEKGSNYTFLESNFATGAAFNRSSCQRKGGRIAGQENTLQWRSFNNAESSGNYTALALGSWKVFTVASWSVWNFSGEGKVNNFGQFVWVIYSSAKLSEWSWWAHIGMRTWTWILLKVNKCASGRRDVMGIFVSHCCLRSNDKQQILTVQRPRKKYADFVKQQSGRTRQNS